MNFKGISYYLHLSCYPVTILSFFNILYCSYFDHYLNLDSYLSTLVTSLLFALIFYFISRDAEKNIKFFDQLLLIFLVYFFVSLLISIPYYFSYYQLTFIDSFFEAISGLTTTGFTVFYNRPNINNLEIFVTLDRWLVFLNFFNTYFFKF